MRFRRIADNEQVTAKVWQRHGDHPSVRRATATDIPFTSQPERYGYMDGYGIVLPGDFVVSGADGTRLVRERIFRKDYEPSPG